MIPSSKVIKCPDCGAQLISLDKKIDKHDYVLITRCQEQMLITRKLLSMKYMYKDNPEVYRNILRNYVNSNVIWNILKVDIKSKYNIDLNEKLVFLDTFEVYRHE